MVNCQVKMRGKDAVNTINMNFIQIDAQIVNSFSRFLMGHLEQSIKFHRLKSLRFDRWNLSDIYQNLDRI